MLYVFNTNEGALIEPVTQTASTTTNWFLVATP
jgi:hypothetical protein